MSSRDDRRNRGRSLERDVYNRNRDRGGGRDRERDRDRERERDREGTRRGGYYGSGRRSRSKSPPRRGSERDRRGYGRDRYDDRRDKHRERDRGRLEEHRDRSTDGRDGRRVHGRDQDLPVSKRTERDRDDHGPSIRSGPPPTTMPGSGSRRLNLDPDNNGREEGEEGEEGEPMDAEDDAEAAMKAMMGFGGFDSTKGKPVTGNEDGAVEIKKQRTWRQYMNRRGGFNRPLDKIK